MEKMNEIFYAVQEQVDGFGHDTATIICFRTKNECKNWLKENAEKISKNNGYETRFEIVKQKFGTDFEEIFG